jgi:UDP-N-acetylglucosamine--N-acetylmuramyl-(pentapeptide) pyrophosphoryl-undecaprenol N-acetylglucosamine transferase
MIVARHACDLLAVASGGGHLQQLAMLLPRTGAPPELVTWVTYDVPQARSLLEGKTIIFAHHPTTKNMINAGRNLRLARQVIAAHGYSRVVSTGAAVAVPFMLRAQQLDIPCHYIESATRATGPSLSGRILERIPGIHLYRQMGEWGRPRWRQGPSVFDGFEVTDVECPVPPSRAVVSLGTHRFPFTSFVERLRGSAPHTVEVTWQLGSTPAPTGLRGRYVDQLPANQLSRLMSEADIVVGHAGVGLALTALSAGKVPVLVPRRRLRGEHTDDHQVELARELDRMGLAVTAEVGELSFEHLERAAALRVTYHEPPPFELVD